MILVLVAVAGLMAGFMNVLAGGGSFLTLPAMIAAGLTALGANASSTVALFPAQAITAAMAQKDMAQKDMARKDTALSEAPHEVSLKMLGVISLVGGFFGAVLLLVTPPGLFVRIVPWLILFATGVFARGEAIGKSATRLHLGRNAIYVIQALVAIYGGYFGGGIGILMLAALTVFGFSDIRVMNSIKIVLAMLMNVAAVVTFVLAGLVQWPATLVLCAAAIAGSLVGMVAAKRVPAVWVRGFVIFVGLSLAAGFFAEAWFG